MPEVIEYVKLSCLGDLRCVYRNARCFYQIDRCVYRNGRWIYRQPNLDGYLIRAHSVVDEKTPVHDEEFLE